MTHGSRTPLATLAVLAAVVAVAVVAVVALLSGGDSGSTSPAAAARGSGAGDPSAAYEQAVATAMPSVVQIESPGQLGSGIVFDDDGDIVTNAHVVSGARTFTITTSDGKRHRAPRCAGRSPPTTSPWSAWTAPTSRRRGSPTPRS